MWENVTSSRRLVPLTQAQFFSLGRSISLSVMPLESSMSIDPCLLLLSHSFLLLLSLVATALLIWCRGHLVVFRSLMSLTIMASRKLNVHRFVLDIAQSFVLALICSVWFARVLLIWPRGWVVVSLILSFSAGINSRSCF